MDGKYYNLWSADNVRLDANDDKVIKTVYDPSPVGFALPASNAFTGFTTTGSNSQASSEFNVSGPFNNGWLFYTKPGKTGPTLFFPASGFRRHGSGALNGVSSYGGYWAAGPGSTSFGRLLDFYSGHVGPLHNDYRGYGFAVRSAKEN